MDDLARWRNAAREVTELLRGYPDPENPWLKSFPHGSCSVTSYAIGRVLLERYREQRLLVSGSGYEGGSHTWLKRDHRHGPSASIDATLYQFKGIANEGFVGWGESPAATHFSATGRPIYVALAGDNWHHQKTPEIYEWLFPQLGLSTFVRTETLRHLLPRDIESPPICELIDSMIEFADAQRQSLPFVILVSPNSAALVLRNSDAALHRYEEGLDKYRGRFVMVNNELNDDHCVFFPTDNEALALDRGQSTLIGSVTSRRIVEVPTNEFEEFDETVLMT